MGLKAGSLDSQKEAINGLFKEGLRQALANAPEASPANKAKHRCTGCDSRQPNEQICCAHLWDVVDSCELGLTIVELHTDV